MPTREPSVLIVGAGMTGLMAAKTLIAYGHRLALVDKGRSAGGRLATRRVGPGRADHGAQFFTVRSPEFGAWVERWRDEGLVREWAQGWSRGPAHGSTDSTDSTDSAEAQGHPRYVVSEGMNALAKRLAGEVTSAGASVHIGVQIEAISQSGAGWWACSTDGRVYTAETLVLTCPVPQSLHLLAEGSVALAEADQRQLASIDYAPCLCGLFVLEGESALPEPGAVQLRGEEITWIADNRRKGLGGEGSVITVHAGPEYSRANYAKDEQEVLAHLQAALKPWLADGARVVEGQLKRWRYAQPTATLPERLLRAQGVAPLFFAGDAFGGPRVEGAALSGLAVAQAVAAVLG